MEYDAHPVVTKPAEQLDAKLDNETAKQARRRWLWPAVAVVVALLVGAAIGILATRPTADQSPANRMTPDLAVAYVQSEFPGQFPDRAKLTTLFKATCHVLDEGGTRLSAITPMQSAGLTVDEASYILDMSIYSTCPKYHQG
jgi:hypothetical protein